jgi:transposase
VFSAPLPAGNALLQFRFAVGNVFVKVRWPRWEWLYAKSLQAKQRPSKASPDKRRKYDEAFKAEALRLADEGRSTQAAARQLGISPKLLYRWQQA